MSVVNHKTKKEKCELCNKIIYKHDTILVCNLDHRPYHAKCLKISIDVALELQLSPDWFCPLCLKYIFPFFDCLLIDSSLPITCNSCRNQVSNTKHHISHCTLRDKICHTSCLTNYAFSSCLLTIDCQSQASTIYNGPIFNPFPDDEDSDKNLYFDDDSDDATDTLYTAKVVLNSCNYQDPEDIQQSELQGTTFY